SLFTPFRLLVGSNLLGNSGQKPQGINSKRSRRYSHPCCFWVYLELTNRVGCGRVCCSWGYAALMRVHARRGLAKLAKSSMRYPPVHGVMKSGRLGPAP